MSAAQVAEGPLQRGEVWLPGIMHMKTDLLHGVRDIRPGEGEVLKCTGQTPKSSGISN